MAQNFFQIGLNELESGSIWIKPMYPKDLEETKSKQARIKRNGGRNITPGRRSVHSLNEVYAMKRTRFLARRQVELGFNEVEYDPDLDKWEEKDCRSFEEAVEFVRSNPNNLSGCIHQQKLVRNIDQSDGFVWEEWEDTNEFPIYEEDFDDELDRLHPVRKMTDEQKKNTSVLLDDLAKELTRFLNV